MIFITTYKTKPYITEDELRELMAAFAEHGEDPGVTAHYMAADASRGVTISERDDAGDAYRNMLNYHQWIEFDTKPMLTIEDAVPHILDALG
jgi:hypothetical protein